jgi:hypothetical protein
MLSREFALTSKPPALAPDNYNPLESLYYEAFIIACAALDGLSNIWVSLEMPDSNYGNEMRFTTFLSKRKVHKDIDRVCTPFLYYFLREKKIEQGFRDLVYDWWVKRENAHAAHHVFEDPEQSELVKLYGKHGSGSIKKIKRQLAKFAYGALIYKYYRCSFVHEFTASHYVASFRNGNSISVFMRSGVPAPTLDSAGELAWVTDKEGVPQLSVGLEVLTNGIREGADYIASRMLAKKKVGIPHSKYDSIRIETMTPRPNWFKRLSHCLRS